MIIKVEPGSIFTPKEDYNGRVFIQVSKYGDCGIFLCQNGWDADCDLLFRILINENDIRKKFDFVSTGPINFNMENEKYYSESPIGDTRKFKVKLSDLDNRIPISDEEFAGLEPLAVWAWPHLQSRLNRLQLN